MRIIYKQDVVEGSNICFVMIASDYLLILNFFLSVVKLIKNFRSHKAILQFPNEKFYRGDLVPFGDPSIINSFLKSPCLPSKNFPVIFHSVYGKDDREASSPSFFNVEEVLQVKYYVQKLKKDRKFITGNFFSHLSSLISDCFSLSAL